jgi:hypothetical protein
MNPSEQFVEQGISHQVLIFLHFKYEIVYTVYLLLISYAWFHFMYQNLKRTSCANVLTLAYQSLGVVYGDLSTSPLYVYKTSFSGKLSLKEDDEEIFGVLSFIFWTFTIIALFKYVFIVMSADDNGEGTIFNH